MRLFLTRGIKFFNMESKVTENIKNVVITGTSSGFGENAAKAFADKGYSVWATMRDTSERNAAKKKELESCSTNITVIEMDVADDGSVQIGFEDILNHVENVHILINNAGIMYTGITEGFSVSQAHEQMNTNYYGAIRATQAVLPGMRKAGDGLIINTSSIAGRIAAPYFGTYAATKFALEAYSQSLRYEVAP
jgi:short-subunit dehydrogenase